MEREENFRKGLECTLPLHNLKASILNSGIIFFVWCLDTVTTPLDLEDTLFLCDDKNHLHKCMVEFSLL